MSNSASGGRKLRCNFSDVMLEFDPSFLTFLPSAFTQPKNSPTKKRGSEESLLPGIIDGGIPSDTWSDNLPKGSHCCKLFLKSKNELIIIECHLLRRETIWGLEDLS